jgi:hydrogenase nickel incorporation protein HypA/HybF
MHELSIAASIVSTVGEALPGRKVLAVQLRIGLLAGIVPEALDFAWDVVTCDTQLAGSALRVERPPLAGRCLDCDARSAHERPPPLACPECGGRVLPDDLSAARAMEVVSVEIDDEEPGPGDGRAPDDREQG